MISLWT